MYKDLTMKYPTKWICLKSRLMPKHISGKEKTVTNKYENGRYVP